MKKIFSLLAAVLFAGSMMAESISITPDLLKSSYQDGTITIGEVSFAYAGAMYNGKNQPSGFASKQLIQLRKSGSGAGEIKNSTELNLKSITVATQNDKDFTLSAGAAADALEAVVKPAGTAGKYACKDNNDGDKEADVTLYTFNVEGKKYFDLLNGANAQYIAYITIELAEGGETPVDPQPATENIVYNWNTVGTTILGGSTVTEATVKIHTNTDEVPCLKFANSYVYADGKWAAIKPAEGAFKAGDTVKVAICFNNSDDTKYAMVDLYAADHETRLWRTDSATTINGRTSAADPAIQEFVLTADQDSLFLGRYGSTAMCVTLLKVVRPAATPEPPVVSAISLTQFIADKPATEVELKDLTVIYATGKNTYVIDEDGVALVMYDASKTYYDGTLTAGKVLSGQKATYTSYNNQDEIIPTNAVVATDGTAPVPVTMAAAPSVDANVNQYLRFENVAATETSGKYYIFDNVQLYGASADLKPTEAGNYNVEGIFINFKGNTPELIVTAIEKAGGVTPVEGDTILLDVDYADAMHITSYQAWQLNFYKDYSQAEGVTYPDFYVMLKEKSATTLAGTYSASAGEIYFVQVFTSEKDSASAVQVTEFKIEYKGEGMYAVQFAFLGDDGNTYVLMGNFEFDAYEYDTWEEIELTDALVEAVENVDAAVKAVKMLINGNVVIEKNGVQYNVNGAKL